MLRDKLGRFYQWARSSSRLSIVIFEVSHSDMGPKPGLANPAAADPARRKPHRDDFRRRSIKPDRCADGTGIAHVSRER